MHVHGENLKQKETHPTKYKDETSKEYIKEIRVEYDVWKTANAALKGPSVKPSADDMKTISKRVKLFSDYKDFIDQQKYAEQFDARSNLHSSVLEEFIYYLFHDLVLDYSKSALIGKGSMFKDIFFNAPNFKSMIQRPHATFEEKDHDFVIGIIVDTKLCCEGSEEVEQFRLQIPAVAIECKTYLDKTMLEGSSTAAEQLKMKNPNAIYMVAAEWLKLTEGINLRKFKVDQIYILRKQKNTDREFRYAEEYRKTPIQDDVVVHMFETVRTHLTKDWETGIAFGLERGYLL